MLNYKFDKDGVYVVPCTYGHDSMALVDMLQKEGIKPIIAAINYNKYHRTPADYEALGNYCKDHGLVYEYLSTDALNEEAQHVDGDDFVEWARKVRYDFFQQIYEKYHADALVLAHQQDDIIEAYLDQKERKTKTNSYEFSTVSSYNGMLVVRPLLAFSSQDLQDYDDENHVPYSTEGDAYETEHTRSHTRRQIISKLSEAERERLMEEMHFVNDDSVRIIDSLNTSIDEGEELEIRVLFSLTQNEFASTITKFVQRYSSKVKLTPATIAKIREFMINGTPTEVFKLADDVFLIKEYDLVTIGHNFDSLPYSYTLEAPGVLHTDQFDLDFSMGAEDRKIYADDYPLTIRSAIPTDFCVIDSYLQQVRSLFKVWQMPNRLRNVWPIFLNKDGKIIYVPRYRIGFSEYHTSVLKIHLKEDER